MNMPESQPTRQKFSDDEYLELYRLGAPDTWIAHHLNVSVSAVRERRLKLGLPSNFPSYPGQSSRMKIDPPMVLFYWMKGMNDHQIAYWLDVNKSTVRYWRNYMLRLPIQTTRPDTEYVWKLPLARFIKGIYPECGARNIARVLGIDERAVVQFACRKGFSSSRKEHMKKLHGGLYRQLTESEKEKLKQLSKPRKKRPSHPESPRTFTCQKCKRDFEALAFNRKYCDSCRNIKELHKSSLAYEVWNTRREFYNLAKDDPDKAKKIIGEMMDEGEDIKTILQVADMIIEKLEK
jgi:hypothetical protein